MSTCCQTLRPSALARLAVSPDGASHQIVAIRSSLTVSGWQYYRSVSLQRIYGYINGYTATRAASQRALSWVQVVVGLVTADVLKAIAGNEVRRQQPGGMAGLAAHLLTQHRHVPAFALAVSCRHIM